jgi:tetratricopeptide (TPR) repeat protein
MLRNMEFSRCFDGAPDEAFTATPYKGNRRSTHGRGSDMKLTDSRGLPVSTSSMAALEKYELAACQTLGYFGNPLATLEEALAEDADFAAAHALRADLAVMSSEQGALPLIQESLAAFERIGGRATAREQAHVASARAWLEGRFELAAQSYGAIAIEHPRDLIALQAGHVIDFYLGDSILLRDRIAQALPYWNHEAPGYGYLLGMHAFGLEETGNYARAEDVGRHALALDARDPWAVHAVQHVFEMQGRIHDGVEWLNATAPNWADSALAFHNWWHLALHQLELGDIPAALDVYDRLVHPKETVVALELVDASQLLSRIALRGGTVGSRWQSLADCWAQTGEGGFYVFNDLHALLAFAFAGREQDTRRMLSALEKSAHGTGTNAENVRAVGLPLALAIGGGGRTVAADPQPLLSHRRQQRAARPGAAHRRRRGARRRRWPPRAGPRGGAHGTEAGEPAQLAAHGAGARGAGRRLRGSQGERTRGIAQARATAAQRGLKKLKRTDNHEEKAMFHNMLYRGLPTSLLLALTAFVQYYAVRAFA